jgi:hypothetical protein
LPRRNPSEVNSSGGLAPHQRQRPKQKATMSTGRARSYNNDDADCSQFVVPEILKILPDAEGFRFVRVCTPTTTRRNVHPHDYFDNRGTCFPEPWQEVSIILTPTLPEQIRPQPLRLLPRDLPAEFADLLVIAAQ